MWPLQANVEKAAARLAHNVTTTWQQGFCNEPAGAHHETHNSQIQNNGRCHHQDAALGPSGTAGKILLVLWYCRLNRCIRYTNSCVPLLQTALDLRLQPKTYVSPSHAPISDVMYRVEVRLCILPLSNSELHSND